MAGSHRSLTTKTMAGNNKIGSRSVAPQTRRTADQENIAPRQTQQHGRQPRARQEPFKSLTPAARAPLQARNLNIAAPQPQPQLQPKATPAKPHSVRTPGHGVSASTAIENHREIARRQIHALGVREGVGSTERPQQVMKLLNARIPDLPAAKSIELLQQLQILLSLPDRGQRNSQLAMFVANHRLVPGAVVAKPAAAPAPAPTRHTAKPASAPAQPPLRYTARPTQAPARTSARYAAKPAPAPAPVRASARYTAKPTQATIQTPTRPTAKSVPMPQATRTRPAQATQVSRPASRVSTPATVPQRRSDMPTFKSFEALATSGRFQSAVKRAPAPAPQPAKPSVSPQGRSGTAAVRNRPPATAAAPARTVSAPAQYGRSSSAGARPAAQPQPQPVLTLNDFVRFARDAASQDSMLHSSKGDIQDRAQADYDRYLDRVLGGGEPAKPQSKPVRTQSAPPRMLADHASQLDFTQRARLDRETEARNAYHGEKGGHHITYEDELSRQQPMTYSTTPSPQRKPQLPKLTDAQIDAIHQFEDQRARNAHEDPNHGEAVRQYKRQNGYR
ncbi:type III effector protein [Ralstonia solanacearum]|uniref:type III effector protein n=1 Tax=Ralstonia solanacearum TaxID=305 RepID=UPI0018D007AD|nr:type III effector protein [Ralstonia solanacearum]